MSMIKYGFEIFLEKSDEATQAMQEWMFSPMGATVTLVCIASSVSFSLMAKFMEKNDKKPFKMILIT
ncbi:MAG: hypothetical protein ACRCXC_01255 [Legionella sp.]